MIDITFDTTTGAAKLATVTPVKAGKSVPVRLTFSAAPNTVTGLQLALGSDATPPAVLAFIDVFSRESDTIYTAVLDASDSRLVTFLGGKASVAVNAELGATLDGVAQTSPNFQVTVQAPIVTGATTSDGGPVYYTSTQVDAAIAAAVAAGLAGLGAIRAGNVPLVSGQEYIDVTFSAFTDASWEPETLVVVNTTDSPPLRIWPGLITAKAAGSFRLYLSAAPDSANYHLSYRCKHA